MGFAGDRFGLLYFAALRRIVTLLAARGGWAMPLLLTVLRIGGALVFFALAATWCGAVARRIGRLSRRRQLDPTVATRLRRAGA